MERIRQFVSAIISGLMIGVGGTIFLMQENTLAGSFLFSAGLMTILIFGFQSGSSFILVKLDIFHFINQFIW